MATFDHAFDVRAPVGAVADFHGSSDALQALTPPGSRVVLHEGGVLRDGLIVRFTMYLGPIPVQWTASHEDVGPTGFVDVMLDGPMEYWRHTHRFIATGDRTSRVEDHIEYTHPRGAAGIKTRLLFGSPALRVLFAHRKRATKRACE